VNALEPPPPRLWRTTAIRLAVGYVLAYALALVVALAAVSWTTAIYSDARARSQLQQELKLLTHGSKRTDTQAIKDAMLLRMHGASRKKRLYLLVSADGNKLVGNLLAWPTEEDIPVDGQVRTVEIELEVLPPKWFEDDSFIPVIATELPDGGRLLLGLGVAQAKLLQDITEYLSEGLLLAVLLSLAMGLTLGRAILQRINTISSAAARIMAGDLSRRVPVSPRNDEFDALAGRLNAMLGRIQQLIKGMREVTDNIAHDLRSPLTRLRSQLEITLLEPRTEEQYRRAIALGIEESESLIRTFNSLLEIAQAHAGQFSGNVQALDLCALAHDLVEFYGAVAEEAGLALAIEDCSCVNIEGSRDLIAQAIGNLLENAIKYTPAGGAVTVQVIQADNAVELRVNDNGPGIAEAERARVLERFVRLESARHTPGNGLGLSLVQAVARLHQAELTLRDGHPGLHVSLRFPRMRSAKAMS